MTKNISKIASSTVLAFFAIFSRQQSISPQLAITRTRARNLRTRVAGVLLSALVLAGNLLPGFSVLSQAPILGELAPSSVDAAVGINEQLNFQARLMTAGGALVPDGNYNMQFQIYQDGDGDPSTADETAKWIETRRVSDSTYVRVTNGYVSVKLGSVNAFGSSVDWHQSVLWLSINIGNTVSQSNCLTEALFNSNCAGDGEMNPMFRLTAVPQAFNADRLDGLSSTDFLRLQVTAAGTTTVNLQDGSNTTLAVTNSGAGVANISADGSLVVGAGQGIDIPAGGGVLGVGNTVATTVNIGNTAATTLALGAGGALTRAINIGTGTGVDTISIGTGGTGADVIAIGSANAGNVTVQSNAVLNLTGSTNSLINFPNFDVATNGNITVAAAQGIDTNAAGVLAVGNTTATTVNIGNTAATTLALGAGGALTRAINIGTGTGVDTISIGTGGTGADVISIGSANAGNVTVQSNAILNLTGSTNSLINFPNFDVATNGNITVAAAQGLDTNAAGVLAVGNTTATTVNIGNTAATTLALGAGGALTRAINIGTGTGVDTISIGTGGTGADVISIGSANAGNVTVRSNAVLNLTGSTNSIIDFPNFDVATTGNITVAAAQGIDTNAAGVLAVGNTTATTVNIGNTAATTLALGAGGALTRAINIGTGTGVDTISIGTGGTGADVITIGSSNAGTVTVQSAAGVNITGSSASTFTLAGVAVTAAEFNVLDGGIGDVLSDLVIQGTATDEFCLTSETGGGALLAWQACGGTTLSGAYTAGSTGDQIITYTSANDSVIFRNPTSSGSDSAFTLKVEQLNTGIAQVGLMVTQAGTGIAFRVNDDGTDTDSTPFVVDASGNIGVGTATPTTAKLQVVSSGTGLVNTASFAANPGSTGGAQANQIILNNTHATNAKNQILFQTSGTSRWALGNDAPGTGAQDFFLYDSVAGATRIEVNSTGQVGIGAPTALNSKLHVYESANQNLHMQLQRSSNTYHASTLYTPAGAISGSNVQWYTGLTGGFNDYRITSWNGSAEYVAMNIGNNGTVGIGTIGPGAKLEVDTDPGDNTVALLVKQQDTTNNNNALVVENTGSGLSLRVDDASGDTTPFVIDANGNVGIGDATPDGHLDIEADATRATLKLRNNNAISKSAEMEFSSGGASGYWTMGTDLNTNGGDNFFLYGGGSDESTHLYVDGSGRLQVGMASGGSTPDGRLHVRTRSASTIGAIIQGASSQTADLLQIRSSGASSGDHLTVTASGNVGIGTATPTTAKLLVSKSTQTNQDWSKITQSTAGTIAASGTSAINSSGVVSHNGSLYAGTSKTGQAEVYRYDGGTTWTKISQTTAGTLASGGTAAIDSIRLATSGGTLYARTSKGSGQGEIYRYDGGTTWTKISQTTAGTLASGGTSAIDSFDLVDFSGTLYAGTIKSSSAEVYRYDGGTTWTKVSQTTAGTIAASGTSAISEIGSMTVHGNQLYVGTYKSGAAEVYRYDGGTTWTKVSQAAAGTIASGDTSNVSAVYALASNGSALYAGTYRSGGSGAEIYRYDGGTTWTKVSQTTAGTIAASGTSSIDLINYLVVYNNSLYAGTNKTGQAEIYRYDGGTTWTKVSQTTAGTIAASGTSAIDNVGLAAHNGSLYTATSKSSATEVYRYGDNVFEVRYGDTSSVMTVGATGTTSFRNTSNSNAAFQIQSAGGYNLLTADTTNLKIGVAGDLNVGDRFGNRQLSDGFESGDLSLWELGDVGAGSSISVQSNTKRNGKYAAQITYAGTNAYRYNYTPTTTTKYFRSKVFIASHTAGDVALMRFEGESGTVYRLERAIATGNLTGTNGGTGTTHTTCGALTVGVWHQVELRITVNASSGTFEVWLNGSKCIDVTANTGSAAIGGIYLGDWSSSRTATVIYDDVVVDSNAPGSTTSASLNVDDSLHVGGSASFGGSVLVQTGSTKALQVQNASGTSVLTVNTTSSQVTMRGTTSDATAGSELASGTTCSGTNWSGTGPWTHTTGATTALSCTVPASVTAGATYQVVFTVASNSDTSYGVKPILGGTDTFTKFYNNATHTYVVTATNTTGLSFNPDSLFNGSINSISVKLMTNSNPVLSVQNSSGVTTLEVRSSSSATNTFVGLNAGENNGSGGTWNTALGVDALKSNISGDDNVAIGADALLQNTTGSDNVALGSVAMWHNTTGKDNVAIGSSALYDNTTGWYNVAVGKQSLISNTNGDGNVAVGLDALNLNTIGSYSVSLGYASLYNNTTGSNNVAIGGNAGQSNMTGSNNVYIGYAAGDEDPTVTTFDTQSDLQKSIAIGYGAQVHASNSLILGGQGTNQVNVGIGGSMPSSILNVTPVQYSTGTVSTTASSTTITGSGTTWTSAMVGSEIIIANNNVSTTPFKGTITEVASTTSMTVSVAPSSSWSGRNYRIHYAGLQVSNSGTVGIGSNSPGAMLHVSGRSTTLLKVTDTSTSGVAGNISTATYDNAAVKVIAQDTQPRALFFKDDGTKMYMLGTTNSTVYQYTLATPWSVSSASYDSVSFSITSQDTAPKSIFIGDSGTKMYISGDTGDSIYQYTLSTAWDLSTASYASLNKSITQDTQPYGVYFKSDGTKMYVTGTANDTVYQFTLSTAWNVSTATYDTISLSVTGLDTNPRGVNIKSDGTKLYVHGDDNNQVHQYTLGTPWSLSGASSDSNNFTFTTQEGNPLGVYIKPDISRMFMTGLTSTSVHSYSIGSTSQDVLTIASGGATTLRNQTNSTTALQVQNSTGTSILTVDTTNREIELAGDLKIGGRPDSGGTTADWSRISQSTAGTIATSGTASINSVASSAVYNGSLYIGTAKTGAAEVYRYDGGTTWTKVTQSTAGTVAASGTASIDSISSMIVYNGHLYIGTAKSTAAEVYRYDGGTSWTRVTSATPGTVVAAGNSGINEITSMAVYDGWLFIGTAESNAAEIYRYDDPLTQDWRSMHQTASTPGSFATRTGVDRVGAMAVYRNKLYASIETATTATAEVIRMDSIVGSSAGTATWTGINISGTAGAIRAAQTNVARINSMVVYNDQLIVGTEETSEAEVMAYNASSNRWEGLLATNGTIAVGGTSAIDNVRPIVYNGRLYAYTTEANSAELYLWDNFESWSKVSQTTAGTLMSGGTASIDGIQTAIAYNDYLYLGTSESTAAQVYTFRASEGLSYALKFGASADDGNNAPQQNYPNEGSIRFSAERNSYSNQGSGLTGSFMFSHGLMTNTGAYDIAEDYATRDDSLETGDIVSVDPNEKEFVLKSKGTKYDPQLLGIYSTKPGLRFSQLDKTINGGRAVPIALAGRVPVKVTTENGPIKAGDSITTSSIPGVGMKADEPGRIIGTAMESFNGEGVGKIVVFVNPGFDMPTDYFQGESRYIQNGDIASFMALNVSGTAAVGELIVYGDARIEGKLTVKDIEISGHLSTSGDAPEVLGVAEAGTLDNIEIEGNDTAGTITIKAVEEYLDLEDGKLVSITFAAPYSEGKKPRVILTPANGSSIGAPIYVNNAETDHEAFELWSKDPLIDGKTYIFNYWIVE